MTPSTIVSQITNDARVTRAVAPIYQPDIEQPGQPYRAETAVTSLPADEKTLPSPQSTQEMASIRESNTRQLMRSNRWFEVANILRWCTTGLIGLTGVTIVNAAGFGGGAAMTLGAVVSGIGAALTTAPVLLSLAAFAVAATATIKVSQFSRKLMAEKTFDVQETFVQRQAALINTAVEKSVTDQQRPTQSWVARTQSSLDQAQAQQALS